jgi:hypothetical protein
MPQGGVVVVEEGLDGFGEVRREKIFHFPGMLRPAPAAGLMIISGSGAERWLLRGAAGDTGDELPGDLAELEVAVLGGCPQDGEGVGGGAPLLGHDHADGLVDHGPGGQRGAQLAGQR